MELTRVKCVVCGEILNSITSVHICLGKKPEHNGYIKNGRKRRK